MRKIKKLFAGCLILVMFSTLYSPALAANNSEDVAEVVLREVTSLYHAFLKYVNSQLRYCPCIILKIPH